MIDLRKDFFDRHAPAWEQDEFPAKQERLRLIFSEFASSLGSPVLDLGSGTGILIPLLAGLLPARAQILEFDLAYQMLRQAGIKCAADARVRLINGDAHFLPFAAGTVRTAVCFEALPHFHNLPAALQEIHRVLQPGGDLVILHLMGQRQLNEFHRRIDGIVCRDYLPPLQELGRTLRDLGFTPLQQAESDDLYLLIARKC